MRALLLLGWFAAQPAATEPSLAVLDIGVRTERPGVQEAVPLLVASLAARLDALKLYRIITVEEVRRVMEAEASRQGGGCTDDGCLAAVASALNADLVATGDITSAGSHLLWTASLLEQASGRVVRRAQIKAESVEALTALVEEMALALSGKQPATSLDGPDAPARFGFTNQDQFEAFKPFRLARSALTTTEALTTFLINRNVESNVLALLEALAFGGAAAAVVTLAVVSNINLVAYTFNNPPLLLVGGIGALLLMPVAIGLGAAGLGLATLDAFDVGRVDVKADGCCRDDASIHDAETRRGVRDALALAAVLAGPAACTGGVLSLAIFTTSFALQGLIFQSTGFDVADKQWPAALILPALGAWFFSFWAGLPLACMPLLCGTPVAALLLLWPERSVVDVENLEKPARKGSSR